MDGEWVWETLERGDGLEGKGLETLVVGLEWAEWKLEMELEWKGWSVGNWMENFYRLMVEVGGGGKVAWCWGCLFRNWNGFLEDGCVVSGEGWGIGIGWGNGSGIGILLCDGMGGNDPTFGGKWMEMGCWIFLDVGGLEGNDVLGKETRALDGKPRRVDREKEQKFPKLNSLNHINLELINHIDPTDYDEAAKNQVSLQEKLERAMNFSLATFVARERWLNNKNPSDVAPILIEFLVKVCGEFPERHVARDDLV
ncbi:hypothetical protein Tco_1533630 [Tanacetum coccineum]